MGMVVWMSWGLVARKKVSLAEGISAKSSNLFGLMN